MRRRRRRRRGGGCAAGPEKEKRMGEVRRWGGLWCKEVATVYRLWWWFVGEGGGENRASGG
jgi:hypothetical protein